MPGLVPRCFSPLLVAVLLWPLLREAGRGQESLRTLQTAAEVRNLPAQEAARHYPVHLRATVTCFNPVLFSRFVQDETAGIYLREWSGVTALAPGQIVEIDGITDAGEYAPVVAPLRVTPVGQGPMPPAKPVSYESLIGGREDSQWVEISGVVRTARHDAGFASLVLEVAVAGGRVTVYAPASEGGGESWVDAGVRVRGVCSGEFSRTGQLRRIRLLAPRQEDVMVEEPAPREPFAAPVQPLGSLLQFTSRGARGHRVKVAGTVVYSNPGTALCIQDKSQGLMVQTTQRDPASLGDYVEVIGFPSAASFSPVLADAIYRVKGRGEHSSAAPMTDPGAPSANHDSRLVQVDALLVDWVDVPTAQFLILANHGHIFQGTLPLGAPRGGLPDLKLGSGLRVVGVCVPGDGGELNPDAATSAGSFRLLLRSAADVTVISTPPWWNVQRVLWMLAGVVAVTFVAFAWVGTLRSQVRRQTTEIRGQRDNAERLQQRYAKLFENANDMVYTHDPGGTLTSANRAGEELLQRQENEIVGRQLQDFVVPEQRLAASRWVANVVSGTAPENVEWDFATATGDRVKLEIRTRRIEEHGRLIEVEGVARDITERKRLEQEILEISNREQLRIGQDLHDGVCQQLAGISFLTETLAEVLHEKSAAEATEAERLGTLLKAAISQARGVARGLAPLRLAESGLAPALDEMVKSSQNLFQVTCTFELNGPAPALAPAVAIHLYYIAREAVANAAKHGEAKEIKVTLNREDDQCGLIIRDNGDGFVPDSRLYSGMGMRIMKYRARVVGASLDIQSAPGEGTEVRCLFSLSAQLDATRA